MTENRLARSANEEGPTRLNVLLVEEFAYVPRGWGIGKRYGGGRRWLDLARGAQACRGVTVPIPHGGSDVRGAKVWTGCLPPAPWGLSSSLTASRVSEDLQLSLSM